MSGRSLEFVSVTRVHTKHKANSPAPAFLILAVLLLVAGCATTITINGPGEADIFVSNPPGAKELTYAGRGRDGFVYALPHTLVNQKVVLLVKSDFGSWRYTVFTDRDLWITYPPKGLGDGVGAVEAVMPEAAPPASAPAAAGGAEGKGKRKEKGQGQEKAEEPSATITPQ